jgi:hypothetical protein
MQTLTKNTIKKLLKKTRHVVDVEDFDLIEELEQLALKVSGVSIRERRLLNSPFELCGIKFYPLTVAKSLWFTEKVEEWEIEGAQQEALLFWLLTLPLTEEALDITKKQSDKGAKKLSRGLHCSPVEMGEVYQKCVGVREPDNDKASRINSAVELVIESLIARDDNSIMPLIDKLVSIAKSNKISDDTEADYGGTIACLVKEYGGTPDQWLYETPVEKMASLFDQYEKRVTAEENASRSKSASGGKAVAPKVNQSMRSLGDFNAKAKEIEQKWSA